MAAVGQSLGVVMLGHYAPARDAAQMHGVHGASVPIVQPDTL
jgi:hypothetical protein